MKMLLSAMLKCERADTTAQDVLDWFDAAARKEGWPIEIVQVLPYDPPAEPDPTLTEVGVPE